MDITINALMILSENQQRRVWFVIMSLLPFKNSPPSSSLAEGRKYGGCLLVGFQSKPQLEEIYGRHGTEAMWISLTRKSSFGAPSPQRKLGFQFWEIRRSEPSGKHLLWSSSIEMGSPQSSYSPEASRYARRILSTQRPWMLCETARWLSLHQASNEYQKPPALRQGAFLLSQRKQEFMGRLLTPTSHSGESPCPK